MKTIRIFNRMFAIMIAFVLVISLVNIPPISVKAASTQTSTNSGSDSVKATIVENATNQYWYEYNITVTNNSSSSICGWKIKAYLPNVNVSDAQSWDTCKMSYEGGYLYIEGIGDGSVVPAGGNNATYQVKFGLGRSIGLDTSDIVSITYENGTENNSGVEEFELNYTLTGQTKDLAFKDTPVGRHGKLHVDGIYLYDENNEKFQLRGASLHGIQWDVGYNYINKGAFQSLRDEWGINAIRLPVYVTQNGYTEGAASSMDSYIQSAVDYATDLGMYVLIDWHVHSAYGGTTNPNTWKSQANTFFDKYANMYKNYENVLFEICNEPVNTPWYDGSGNDIYSYANYIIPTIRKYTDAIVIVGTNTWSQDVDEVAAHKLTSKNTMYTIHFYSATHMDNIRSKVTTAINSGVPVFCTEFGVCSADGNGSYNLNEADKWMELFDQYSVSYFCWQLSNKNEKSSYLAPSSNKTNGGWTNGDLSTTGKWLVNENRPKSEAEDEKYSSGSGSTSGSTGGSSSSGNTGSTGGSSGSGGNTGSTGGSSSSGGNTGSTGGSSSSGGNTGSTGGSSSSGGNAGSTGGSSSTGGTSTGDSSEITGGGNTGGTVGEVIERPEEFVAPEIEVSYRTHIQTFGWEDDGTMNTDMWKKDGRMSGTSGMSKRLEGINIVVESKDSSKPVNLGIQYTTHCQNYGWLPWSANGDMNGTEGESKRLEAIMIKLTGSDAKYYDVYYRVHAQNYGWLNWASNGAPAGTAGYSKRLEGIQIVVVKKGADFNRNADGIPSTCEKEFYALPGNSPIVNYPATSNTDPVVPGDTMANVTYRTHVQNYGWQGWKYNGQMSGTSGESKRLEGINIKLTNKPYDGGIAYTTHVQTYGWQGDENDSSKWMTNGKMSGTSGESKRLEAIKIKLTGEMAEHYDIYYRVHAQTYGWLGWAKNGDPAGTAGLSRRLEGIQIVLVKKGENPPANTYMGETSARTEAYIQK